MLCQSNWDNTLTQREDKHVSIDILHQYFKAPKDGGWRDHIDEICRAPWDQQSLQKWNTNFSKFFSPSFRIFSLSSPPSLPQARSWACHLFFSLEKFHQWSTQEVYEEEWSCPLEKDSFPVEEVMEETGQISEALYRPWCFCLLSKLPYTLTWIHHGCLHQ